MGEVLQLRSVSNPWPHPFFENAEDPHQRVIPESKRQGSLKFVIATLVPVATNMLLDPDKNHPGKDLSMAISIAGANFWSLYQSRRNTDNFNRRDWAVLITDCAAIAIASSVLVSELY